MNNSEYKKDFWTWHDLKEKLDQNNTDEIFFHEREIWFCSLGVNIGHEQDGTSKELFERPVLILKKFNLTTFWGIPITSKKKTGKYNYQFRHRNRIQTVVLSQIRLFDSKRLTKRLEFIKKCDFYQIKKELIKILK